MDGSVKMTMQDDYLRAECLEALKEEALIKLLEKLSKKYCASKDIFPKWKGLCKVTGMVVESDCLECYKKLLEWLKEGGE